MIRFRQIKQMVRFRQQKYLQKQHKSSDFRFCLNIAYLLMLREIKKTF